MTLVFALHELTRTGSPLVMLNFMYWLKENTNHTLMVVGMKSGELEKEFQSVADLLLIPKSQGKKGRILSKVEKLFFHKSFSEVVLKSLEDIHVDLIYANSVPTFLLATQIKQIKKVPLICHIHEANIMLKLLDQRWRAQSDLVDHFVAPSSLVIDDLKAYLDTSKINVSLVRETPAKDIKVEKYESQEFIIGGSGTVHWRKGPELFVQVAINFFRENPMSVAKFQWLGHIDKKFRTIYEADISKAGLAGKVEFMGAVSDPIESYRNFSVFLLTSREDPYPLVCVENALLKVPIITFDKATGINESIVDGGGVIVPYLDTQRMAEAVANCYNNRSLIKTMGEQARIQFQTSKSDVVFPKLLNIIESTLSDPIL
ncbi:glycosyltransferase family 4 protein [Nonlabens xiamenensis]|uniref:glycosyltransferase family 4 protein n=1 Tax=Nonlabens xiamenensis TaxID=2341043 RepID=UPI000F6103E6|nr:glycosyltransferase [Nonlabens xiamenensis]